jgi:hypothetical protein
MSLIFPTDNNIGDSFTANNGVRYTYDGEKWLGELQPTVVTVPVPANIKIAVKNMSTVLTDDQIKTALAALQIQITRDWAPIWNTTADLEFLALSIPIPANAWTVYIMDNSETANALGYHTFTGAGLPTGRVFAHDCIRLGYSWTVTLSHELLEMLADPLINLSAENEGQFYAYEVGDPCEADRYGYIINDILVTDFVTPAWFNQFQISAGTQYDFCNHITQPFQILSDGYISVYDSASNSWATLTQGNIVVPSTDNASGRNRLTR